MEKDNQDLIAFNFLEPFRWAGRWAGVELNKFLNKNNTKPLQKHTVFPESPPTIPGLKSGKGLDPDTLNYIKGLSDEDKRWLAYGVSGEAYRNSPDEFGVAASMINRMRSPEFPNTAEAVVNQKDPVWQYEAIELGKAVHDPALQKRLFEGNGLVNALQKLNGRKYFKGQTQLQHRSNEGNEVVDGKPIMDPMFHPKGNFFHYGHQ